MVCSKCFKTWNICGQNQKYNKIYQTEIHAGVWIQLVFSKCLIRRQKGAQKNSNVNIKL